MKERPREKNQLKDLPPPTVTDDPLRVGGPHPPYGDDPGQNKTE